MLAKSVSKPFSGKDWIFELKWDGFRAITYVYDYFTVQSRNAKELKHFFPELEELRHLTKNVVVDGEIVTMKQGEVDFHALQERGHLISTMDIERLQNKSPATYVVFDILEKDGQPLVDLPLIERKAILKESVKEGSHVIINDYIEEKGEQFYQRFWSMTWKGWLPSARTAAMSRGLGRVVG
jgi:bifunctional non-homologous end joining protein LigD